MQGAGHPKLAAVDIDNSYILGVIYDDESLTLEMDFRLMQDHPRFEEPDSDEGCYRKGFIRFSDFEDLRLRKAKPEDGKEVDYSDIYSATIEGDYAFISSGWGEIELTAQSIQIAVD
ncbi:hypothetical protein AMC99_00994 [Altererythrobacter epoxidivorans]|uniref:Uncharacterized protein n=1 Tax=Altererythrobacter epoxidivorans TaxID=361183 RepID=A0A0M4MG59_9SPHN|nr:hypothetical protein [Altererythrobacter epoxidivorans]ALE16293.1 hypothetical protein AMC99_00994 [Altererythrobacter epoxidivorans]